MVALEKYFCIIFPFWQLLNMEIISKERNFDSLHKHFFDTFPTLFLFLIIPNMKIVSKNANLIAHISTFLVLF